MVTAVLGEAVFNRLYRSGARLFGRRYEVNAFKETRPGAFCSGDEEGSGENQEGVNGTLLPAPVRTRSSGRPSGKIRPGS